jgi:hypothetical protein
VRLGTGRRDGPAPELSAGQMRRRRRQLGELSSDPAKSGLNSIVSRECKPGVLRGYRELHRRRKNIPLTKPLTFSENLSGDRSGQLANRMILLWENGARNDSNS